MEIRILTEDDRAEAEAFLARHRDSSMFMRSNIRRAGLHFTGRQFEATYVAAFEGGAIAGVVAHTWNGLVLVQASGHEAQLAAQLRAASRRAVKGFSGPRDQVKSVRSALGLIDAPAQLDEDEDLYGLPLAELREPPADRSIICRPARASDRDALLRFRIDYDIEALGSPDDEITREKSATFLDAQLDAGHAWVAARGDELLSLSAFNAALPDIVQLGGIYTPPAFRGRGYAKHAVAAQLRAARTEAASRAVLFTKNPNAVRCYEALGFSRIGEFSLVLFG